MKKTKSVKKTVKEIVTIEILCNQCGNSCSTHNSGGHWDEKNKNFVSKFDVTKNEYYGLIETVVFGGYFSTHLDDTWQYRFSLCEGCLRKMMDKFKIPVEVKSEYTKDFVLETEHKEHMAKSIKRIKLAEEKYRKKNKKN